MFFVLHGGLWLVIFIYLLYKAVSSHPILIIIIIILRHSTRWRGSTTGQSPVSWDPPQCRESEPTPTWSWSSPSSWSSEWGRSGQLWLVDISLSAHLELKLRVDWGSSPLVERNLLEIFTRRLQEGHVSKSVKFSLVFMNVKRHLYFITLLVKQA